MAITSTIYVNGVQFTDEPSLNVTSRTGEFRLTAKLDAMVRVLSIGEPA